MSAKTLNVTVTDANAQKRLYRAIFIGSINNFEFSQLLKDSTRMARCLREDKHKGYEDLRSFQPNSKERLAFKITEGPYKGQVLITAVLSHCHIDGTTRVINYTDCHKNPLSVEKV